MERKKVDFFDLGVINRTTDGADCMDFGRMCRD